MAKLGVQMVESRVPTHQRPFHVSRAPLHSCVTTFTGSVHGGGSCCIKSCIARMKVVVVVIILLFFGLELGGHCS